MQRLVKELNEVWSTQDQTSIKSASQSNEILKIKNELNEKKRLVGSL